MKRITTQSVLLALALFASTVYADIALESKDDVQGTWKLQYTRNSATAKETIPRQDTWVFKNGKVAILNIPRDEGHYDQTPLAYDIENGKLKVPYLSRSGFDTFALVEKTDNSMVLKGKFGEHYYFVKK